MYIIIQEKKKTNILQVITAICVLDQIPIDLFIYFSFHSIDDDSWPVTPSQ